MNRQLKTVAIALLAMSAFAITSTSQTASAQFRTPKWMRNLDPTTSPRMPTPPPAPIRLSIFEYDLNGMRCVFARQNDGSWTEFQGNNRNRFAEVAATADYVELFNPHTNVRVRLYRHACHVNFFGRGWRHLYYGAAR